MEFKVTTGCAELASATARLYGSEQLTQPEPPWGTRSRDVRVMGVSASSVTLSWVDPVIPAWYTATFTRARALPMTMQMTAPAHFMEHRYLSFNAPVTITPPQRG